MTLNRTSDTFLLDAYSGQGGFASGEYLIQHPRESQAKFERRQELAVYPNFTRKIIDVFMGFLWKQAPAREVDDVYDAFRSDASGTGIKLDNLLFTYQRLAMILGTVYIIVDKPRTQGDTRLTQKNPYLALRLPGQWVSERKNALGGWESVTFSEPLAEETVFRSFSVTGWTLSKDPEGREIIEQGDYALGQVPVVALHIAKPLNPTDSRSQSWAYDLANLNWDLYNARSEMRELFRAQTFSILALPVVDDAERERLKDLIISTENALTYNPSGGGKPEFISPPSDPINLYREHVSDTVDDIYRVANLEFVSAGKQAQSAESRAFHFQECNSSLRGMAERCEAAEIEIARLVYLWQGREFSGNIAYPSEFNMTDLASAISTALDAVTLGLGAEFDKALKKRLAKQILANDTSPTVMAAIDSEIDAQGDVYGNRVAQQAGA